MTKKQWKRYAKELEAELEHAYEDVQRQKEINNVAVGENFGLNYSNEQLNKHIDIAEKELHRQEIIINYLEEKLC